MLYPPHRMDLSLSDWCRAAANCRRRDHDAARGALESFFRPDGTCIATLSVRSALDAWLTAAAWPEGDEVLVSAVTIDDIPRIIAAHGLRPVPVEVDPETLTPQVAALERLRSPRTRAVLVADLFGGEVDYRPIVAFARRHGLLVVRDAAQAFRGHEVQSDDGVDVALFSFGTLKTATALGGGLAVVADPGLRARMRAVEARWPMQPNAATARKVARTLALWALQTPLGYTAFAALCRMRGVELGAVVRRMTRGFGGGSVEALLAGLRQRPNAALLTTLHQRLQTFSRARLARRAENGARVLRGVPAKATPGLGQRAHTHWLVVVASPQPQALRAALLSAGFDASGASNVGAVCGEARAERLVARLVFVPAYPELPPQRLQRLAEILSAHDATALPAHGGEAGADAHARS